MNNCFGFMLVFKFSIYFYGIVKKLTKQEKDLYHIGNMKAAELVLVNTKKMPKTHDELKEWVKEKSSEKNYLTYTDVAKDGYIIAGGPVPNILNQYAFLSHLQHFNLPEEFKNIYEIKDSKIKRKIVSFNLFLLKFTRPLLPFLDS